MKRLASLMWVLLAAVLVLLVAAPSAEAVMQRCWLRQGWDVSTFLEWTYSTDTGHSWVVGESGLIMYSSDGGDTWDTQASGVTGYLEQVWFADVNEGWVIGEGGLILHTTNSGDLWMPQASGTDKYLAAASFLDAENAFVVGEAGTALRTSNGGETWQSLTSGVTTVLNAAFFTSVTDGWVGGEAGVLRHTTNGGQTWTPIATGVNDWVQSIFVRGQDIWIAGGFGLLHSTDAGAHWTQVGIARRYYGVAFADEQNGWVVGAQGTILHTNNGGLTWSRQESPVGGILNCVYFKDAGHGWISGASGAALVYVGFQPSFLDVSASHPNFDAIEALARRNVIGGYEAPGGSEFRPQNLIWRQQFAKMIVGSMELAVDESTWIDTDPPFTDLGADDPASLYPHDYVAAAVDNNITKGVSPGLFAPYQDISRAQVITMVVRAVQNLMPGRLQEVPVGWQGSLPDFGSPDHAANMRAAEYNGVLEGLVGFGAAWDPWSKATRAEVAQILWNATMLPPAS